jgi:hypothetical protein
VARLRTLKPGFFANEALASLPFAGRLLYAGLWTIADREGRLLDRPQYIRGQVFPYENVPVERFLAALADLGFIVRYTVGDQRLIAIPTWRRHQHPHPREAPSELPPPPGWQPAEPTAEQPAGQDAEPQPRSGPSRVGSWLLGSGEWGVGSGGRPPAGARPPRDRSGGRRESVKEQLERVLGPSE